MSDRYWNYASSQEQLRQEMLAMWKSLTDPEERKKLKIKQRRETRITNIKSDAGL
jgi:hypothetical protein